MVDLRELVRLGAHFGHIKRRLNPKMKPYIWGVKNNVHLFDVSKTAQMIERASKFLESVAAKKKTILWVGTKKAAQSAIFEAADKLKMPYVNHRWIGGTLSNFSQVKKSVTKLLHYEDVYISTIVLDELEAISDNDLREKMFFLLYGTTVLSTNKKIEDLAEKYVQAEIFPEKYLDDALHLSTAVMYKIDVLISWNFKHLVKRKTRIEVNRTNNLYGLKQIDIIAPPEL